MAFTRRRTLLTADLSTFFIFLGCGIGHEDRILSGRAAESHSMWAIPGEITRTEVRLDFSGSEAELLDGDFTLRAIASAPSSSLHLRLVDGQDQTLASNESATDAEVAVQEEVGGRSIPFVLSYVIESTLESSAEANVEIVQHGDIWYSHDLSFPRNHAIAFEWCDEACP